MLLPRGGRYLNKSPELNNTWLEKKLKSSGFVEPTPTSCFYGTRSGKSIKSPWTSDIELEGEREISINMPLY